MGGRHFFVPKLMGDKEFIKGKTEVNEAITGFVYDTSVHGIPASASATGIVILCFFYWFVKINLVIDFMIENKK